MIRRRCYRVGVLVFLMSLFSTEGWCGAKRIIILKADGLPFDSLDTFVRTRDPYTGKSVLPWIDHVFYKHGARIQNFYSRGLSLSAPSWALIDTGQPSVIKGNLEFDRLTLQSYDYLNVFSHVLKNATGRESTTSGVRVTDEQGLPLLSDAYEPSERYVSAQLFARGLPTGLSNLKRLLTFQNPKEWFDEWTMGFERDSILFEVLERDLIAELKKPNVRYLDFLIPVFDHVVHVNREPEAALRALRQIDEVVGRVWAAVEKSPLANDTALILVSDHGMNTDGRLYSQGYNLVDLFTSAEGGGHHVVTNHPPLGEYAFKSLSPLVPLITTTSPESYYLKGQSGKYPTLLLDADGNERASVYLRNSDLNVLHILFQQLERPDLRPQFRDAAVKAFLAVLEKSRRSWAVLATELQAELAALQRIIQQGTSHERLRGKEVKPSVPIGLLKRDESTYAVYLRSLTKLLAVRPNNFDPMRLKINELLAENSMGILNSIHELQNYVVGLSSNGLVLNDDGSLNMEKSLIRVNYPSLLQRIQTRNNVQNAVGSRPVDFIAAVIPRKALEGALPPDVGPIDSAVWLYSDEKRQALILSRRVAPGQVLLRYLPVRGLKQSPEGKIWFSSSPWEEKLPLCLWEDLRMPEDQRRAWLESWHDELEWLETTHSSRYSNGVISLYEQFMVSPKADKGG
jgi:hypothetical protein